MVCKCIDISHYQGRPDFEEVKAAGVLAMIHKATEGTGYIDPDRATNCSNALEAGLAICTYHFLRPGNMQQQMEFYWGVIDPQVGERMIIDHEDSGVSLSALKQAVQALMDLSDRNEKDIQITIYSGHLLKEQLGNSHDEFLAENTDLWIAHYGVNSPSWPSGTYDIWTLWQYSDQGTIDGINDAKVDLNNFNGSDENLVKWIGPAGQEPAPSPEVAEVDVEVTGDVKVTVNGEDVTARCIERPDRPGRPPATLSIETTGGMTLTINGEEIETEAEAEG